MESRKQDSEINQGEKKKSAGKRRPLGGGHSRRRLLGMSAGVTPFVLTIASRPALGSECTHSALLSGNNSSLRRDPNTCYYNELNPITSAYETQKQAIISELYAAWGAGAPQEEIDAIYARYYALEDDYRAQVSALQSKYRQYPNFYG